MSAQIQQDTQAATGALDSAFGLVNDALDVWSKWTTTKTTNTATKTDIESKVIKDNARPTTNAGASALNPQTILFAAAAIVVGLLMFRRK